MILIVAYVMIQSNPPYVEAAQRMVLPENPSALVLPIITLVGGTIGGYITFAGAHRILDAGIKGKDYLPFVNHSAISAILTTGVMRSLLFLAVLGVVVTGVALNPENPPASVFEHAIGPIGKIFLVSYCLRRRCHLLLVQRIRVRHLLKQCTTN